MAKSLMVASNPAWMIINDNTTRYFVLANAHLPTAGETSEANTQITQRTAGVMSNLYAIVADNTFFDDGVSSSTLRTRKNGLNGNQVLTIPHQAIGEFEDTTHTDTIANGDEFNGQVVLPSAIGTKTVSFVVCSVVFNAPNINTVLRHAATNFADMSDGNSYAFALSDNGDVLNTLFANAEFPFRAAGFIRGLFVKVSSNGNTSAGTNTVVTLYKNQVATGLSISIPANETVQTIFENTVDHVSVADGDTICLVVDSVNSGAVILEIISVEWASTNFKFHSVFAYSGGGMTQQAGNDDYLPIGGGGVAFVLEPEANHRTEMQMACTVSHLMTYVSANTVSSFPGFGFGALIYIRKNSASTAVTVSVPEGGTGFYEDTTHSASFAAGDEITIYSRLSGLSGSMVPRYMVCLIENTEVAVTVHIKGGHIKGGKIL